LRLGWNVCACDESHLLFVVVGISDSGLDDFYTSIVGELRDAGVPCAITGGLACVEYGVAEHTEDCDLICALTRAKTVIERLQFAVYRGTVCRYRKSSPPLDSRWLAGGYTSHFYWPAQIPQHKEIPFLDIFGAPPRVSSSWIDDIAGSFAGLHTVAEMKRSQRPRDWSQATALGIELLKRGDERGWLLIFDANVLEELLHEASPGRKEIGQRPVLSLAVDRSPYLDRAIRTEVEFWTHLDQARLRIYKECHGSYRRALQAHKDQRDDLMHQHSARIHCAQELLPTTPLQHYGIDRLIDDAKKATGIGLDPAMLDYLPDAKIHFRNILGMT
jgi:hypothetical protein